MLVGNAGIRGGRRRAGRIRSQMLDELAAAGYTGTELGDWGYMPTAPAVLSAELGLAAWSCSAHLSRWR